MLERLFWRLVLWASFDRHNQNTVVPAEFMWVDVATCLFCDKPVRVNRGAHLERVSVDASLIAHFWQCRIQRRGQIQSKGTE